MTKKTEAELIPSDNDDIKEVLDALDPKMERRIVAAAKRSSALPVFKEAEDGSWNMKIEDYVSYMEMFGGGTLPFCHAMATGCASISGSVKNAKGDKNDALAIVAEVAPQDGIEAMLATQMAAVHIAMMRHSRLMAGAETIAQLDVHEKVFNKLGRTFAAQVEALRKHRHGGQQKMTVEHVTVEKGGQAIVGNVTKGGDT